MPAGSRSRPTIDAAGASAEKVLLVDDEPATVVLLSRQLSRVGFTAVVATTEEEALALSESEQFRAVIADVEMSDMDGLGLLQRLSPLQPHARFLVLAGRGAASGELLPRGHRIKIFPKPWDEREMVAAVRGEDKSSTCSALPSLAPLQAWPKTHVLLIARDEAETFSLCADLDARRSREFARTVASDVTAACSLLPHHTFDVIVLLLEHTEIAGLEAIQRLQGEAPQIGIVVIMPTDDPEFAVQAIQAGAQDCLARQQLERSSLRRVLRHAVERKRAEWRLASIAFQDPLTGLANRALFRQRVARAAAFAKRSGGHFAVLVLDMDRFRLINQSLGHDAGDVFLREIAQRLLLSTRETDTVARLGGDQFAVLATPLANPNDIEALSLRILSELRRPLDLEATQLEPTASIGAALFPESGRDSDGLLVAAGTALHVAKRNGRNGFHVHHEQLDTTRQSA
jgi:diguanylate cyclase (GGDEF)-like protein